VVSVRQPLPDGTVSGETTRATSKRLQHRQTNRDPHPQMNTQFHEENPLKVHQQNPAKDPGPAGDEQCSQPAGVQSEDGEASGGDVTRPHLPLQLAAQIGRELQARWRAVRNDHRRFADLAVDVLHEFSPAQKLTVEDLVRGLFTDEVLPIQLDPEARFGDASITLFHGREFHVDVVFWLDSKTSVHQHGFSGAFQVLAGSSLHARYSFEQTRYLDDHVHLGRLQPSDLEVLERGDVRPILPGDAYVHALWHLERPSVSFIVREHARSTAQPQYSYLASCLEYDPFFINDQTTTTRLQMLRLLHSLNAPLLGEMIEAVGREGAPLPIVRLTQWVSRRPAGLGQRLVEAVRKYDPGYADALDLALEELEREGRISLVRDKVQDPDQRLLLGLLQHCPDRDQILRHVARLRPSAHPAELISGWIASILVQTHGIEISPAGLAALTSMLASDLSSSAVKGDQHLAPDDARVLRYITRRSRVFAPLFPRAQDLSLMPPIFSPFPSGFPSRVAPDPATSNSTVPAATSPQAFSVAEILSPGERAELLEWARDRIDDFVAETVVRPAADEPDRFQTTNFAVLDELGEWRDRLSQRIHSRFVESSPSLRGSVDARLIMWEVGESLELRGSPGGGPGYVIVLDDAGVAPVMRVYGAASLADTVVPADEFVEVPAPVNTAVVFPGALTVVVQPAGSGNAASRRFAGVGRLAPE
jgi:hypothetical protein